MADLRSQSRLAAQPRAGRLFARGPMFLASELCTQLVEDGLGLEGVKARWAGSVLSGFSVGYLQVPGAQRADGFLERSARMRV